MQLCSGKNEILNGYTTPIKKIHRAGLFKRTAGTLKVNIELIIILHSNPLRVKPPIIVSLFEGWWG